MYSSVIKLTQELIKCPSISPEDKGCQKILISRLKKIGFNIEKININDTCNFFAYKGNSYKETLLFLGHTDVVIPGEKKKWVSPPFKAAIKDNILYGRGVVDMKGAIAAMIIAVEKFVKKNFFHKKRIAFLITSDEEALGTNGIIKVIKKLIKRKERIDYCLIGEPTSIEKIGDVIKNGRRGSLSGELIIYGIQGHVAYSHLAQNPLHKIIPFLNHIINKKWDNGNKYFNPTSLQITSIMVDNNYTNIIPEKCLLKFNFRFNNELTDKLINKEFEKKLNKYQIKNYKIKWINHGKPFLSDKGLLCDVVQYAIKKNCNIYPKISTDGGTSDGRFIIDAGAQIIELGLINKTMHKINECSKLSDLNLLSDIYLSILQNLII